MDEDDAAISIDFLEKQLLPQAVQNRCFCDPGSREIVQYVSAVIDPLKPSPNDDETEYYRVRLVLSFSGDISYLMLIVKMLTKPEHKLRAYDKFMNEEAFYTKMTDKYNLNMYPKCYLADLGRYGRPVIILEDLEFYGYMSVDSDKLDEHHLELCMRAIGRFHQRGLKLKAENVGAFRRICEMLIDTRLGRKLSGNRQPESISRIFSILNEFGFVNPAAIGSKENVTVCHGKLAAKSFMFLYKNRKPVDVKVIGWNRMRHCPIVFDLVTILQDNIAKFDVLMSLLASYVEAAKN